jgi:hypothetical protein
MDAIKAVFANHKRIPTRKAFQIILEVPEEQQKEVFDVLGYPNSSSTIWVGVARLAIEEEKPPFLHNVKEPE